MLFNKTSAAATAVLLAVLITVLGCGGGGPGLDYDESSENPVILFRRLQALAPAYNPDAPVTIYYGDGSVIKREDAYRYVHGKMTEEGLGNVLRALEHKGFFQLKAQYEGESAPGSITEVLEVNLKSKAYKVSVERGAGPAGWIAIVGIVNDVLLPSTPEYVPREIRLYATTVKEEAEGSKVLFWPGKAEELKKAAEASNGLKLSGEAVGEAWKAAGKSFESEKEIFYKAGGKLYGNVHAAPLFPGVPEEP